MTAGNRTYSDTSQISELGICGTKTSDDARRGDGCILTSVNVHLDDTVLNSSSDLILGRARASVENEVPESVSICLAHESGNGLTKASFPCHRVCRSCKPGAFPKARGAT